MNFTHPGFAPYRGLIDSLGEAPGPDQLNALASGMRLRHGNRALRFVPASEALSAAGYETGIAASGCVPTRENNPHDLLNALVWLRFPLLKSALNLRHCLALEQQPEERRQRGRLRDHLTLLDESGLLVASSKAELLDLLRDKRWVELFWDARADVLQHMAFAVVGHGLLEKCLAPFPAMTAKCLLLNTTETSLEQLDEQAAAAIHDAETLELPPLPVLGIPGWDKNESRAYYENTQIFRVPARMPTRAA